MYLYLNNLQIIVIALLRSEKMENFCKIALTTLEFETISLEWYVLFKNHFSFLFAICNVIIFFNINV